MISNDTVKKWILSVREYNNKNHLGICFSEWVGIGDGEEFQTGTRITFNLVTGNVNVNSFIRFHGSGGPVYPGTNRGVVDLNNIPDCVLSRYQKYCTDSQLSKKSKRLSKSKDTFIMSNNV